MKYLKILLPLLLILLMMTACGEDRVSDQESVESTSVSDAETVEELKLIENGSCDFSIVYPADADASIIYAANYLQNVFQEQTGICLEVGSDFLREGDTRENDKCKILVGETNYAECQSVMRDLRYYDYGVKIVGDKLIIAGRNSEDLCLAVDWLAEMVLKNYEKNGDLIIKEEYEYHYEDYTVQSIKVGDNELKDFQFVYADSRELEYITDLRNELAHTYGYYLPIVKDTAEAPADHEIVVGNTTREISESVADQDWLTFTMMEVDGHLVLRTGGLCSMDRACERFLEMFDEAVDGEYSFDEGSSVTRDCYDEPNGTMQWATGSDIRVMDMNILAQDYAADWVMDDGTKVHYESIDYRKEIFYANLDYYQPAIVGIQEMDERVMQALKSHPDYGTKYELLTKTDPLSTLASRQYYTSILYRKDLLTLEEGSFDMQVYDVYAGAAGHRCRNMAWGTFTIKASGKQFVYFVTHWDVSNRGGETAQAALMQSNQAVKKVNELVAQTGLPIFCMADWNAAETTVYYRNFVAGTNLNNTKEVAIKRVNNVGSFHEYGMLTHSAYSCDHIFASKSVTVLQFETLFYNEQIWASDHSWLIADVKL